MTENTKAKMHGFADWLQKTIQEFNVDENGGTVEKTANALRKIGDEYDEMRECLEEAIKLMEDVRTGAYKPDSVTTQPWKRCLSNDALSRETDRRLCGVREN